MTAEGPPVSHHMATATATCPCGLLSHEAVVYYCWALTRASLASDGVEKDRGLILPKGRRGAWSLCENSEYAESSLRPSIEWKNTYGWSGNRTGLDL